MLELTLYDLETTLVELCHELDAAESEEEREALASRVSDYLAVAEEKRDRFAQFLRHLEHLEDAAKGEQDRLSERRKRFATMRERLEGYALRAMDAASVDVLEGQTSTLKRRKNPASVVVDDALLVPLRFMRIPKPAIPEPDRTAIKKAMQAGEMVPGARLEQMCRLEIK